jgi:hypothetical protein
MVSVLFSPEQVRELRRCFLEKHRGQRKSTITPPHRQMGRPIRPGEKSLTSTQRECAGSLKHVKAGSVAVLYEYSLD